MTSVNTLKNLAYLVVTILLCSCQGWEKQGVPSPQRIESIFLTDTSLLSVLPLASRQSVREFYRDRAFHAFWSTDGALSACADSLMAEIRMIDQWGLIPEDYHYSEIKNIHADSLSKDGLMRKDILLTDAYLTLYQHLQKGRLDAKTLARRDHSRFANANAIASLTGVCDRSLTAELRSLEPDEPAYVMLKEALKDCIDVSGIDSALLDQRQKIVLNLERWRVDRRWPDRYVLVNIPAFRLRAVENDSVWLDTPVIVGKRATPSPVLESVIRSFIIYPYWHVPHSISTGEILPLLQKDVSYLQRRNFEVLDRHGRVVNPDTIQWGLYSTTSFPFTLRQREGFENTMGVIKFNFANGYNVYLHDTNTKSLYGRAKRDLSHGCIRVRDAVALAHYLVKEDDIYVSPEDLDQYLSLQQRLTIELRKPIALKMAYFTAEVERGVTRFYDDIYGKDSIMLGSLKVPAWTANARPEKLLP